MLAKLDKFPWKRFAIIPPKSGSIRFWNIKPKHPLLNHIVHQLTMQEETIVL
jgi:hypothetical protein